ncbi:MAG: hypothetical protein HGA19_11330 [Oscillochloris sp.]|nr:hypothetical protein [Oscillochloris sp.]
MNNKRFGKLIRGMINAVAAFDGKQAVIIEEEIGELLGLAFTTIQGYKQGRVPEGWHPIEVLAEFGVQRANLNRIWLRRLLESVRYYDIQRLLDRLTPTSGIVSPLPRMQDNLPAPTYSHFIMRPEAYRHVVEGLNQRSALLVIISMGGMGKSSLALEVAKRCIGQGEGPYLEGEAPPIFNTAVWVSGHDQPAAIGLTDVLDTVAMTLGYPGLTRFSLRERQHELGQILRQQRVLIIVDSLEASSDPALLDWLLRLPEPSKAIVTTRVYRREFQRGAWMVEIDGMCDSEAYELISQTVRRLRIGTPHPDITQRLWTMTGGNPKAIEMALGHVRYTGQPLTNVLNTLFVAQGELFDALFAQSWTILEPAARAILITATLFIGSAPADALINIANSVHPSNDALQKLTELSLIEIVHSSDVEEVVRYTLHPLTRSFIASKLADDRATEYAIRERWLAWCSSYAQSLGGYAINNIDRLSQIDPQEPTFFAAIGWAMEHQHYAEAITLIQALEFYYYVRALWGKKLTLHHWYIDAAYALGDGDLEIAALALQIQMLSQQGSLEEAQHYLPRLYTLAEAGPLSDRAFFSYYHTLGMYRLACGESAEAQHCWEHLLATAERLAGHMQVGAHHWLARSLLAEGKSAEARNHFETALTIARSQGFGRLIGRNQLSLALLEIAEDNLDQAEQRLIESQQLTLTNDWEQHARLLWALARLASRRGLRDDAVTQYQQAHTLLERMGLARESIEVAAELNTDLAG